MKIKEIIVTATLVAMGGFALLGGDSKSSAKETKTDGETSAMYVDLPNHPNTEESTTEAAPLEGVTTTDKKMTVANLKAAVQNFNSVNITFDYQQTQAEGFDIYRSEKQNSGYAKVTSIIYDHNTSFTYLDTNLVMGKTYYYKVVPYYYSRNGLADGNYNWDDNYSISYDTFKTYGVISGPVSAVPNLTIPVQQKVGVIGMTSLEVRWDAVPDAEGYRVYKSTKSNGIYKQIAEITDPNVLASLDQNLICGKKYYYKVKAYKSFDGVKVEGPESVKMKGVPAPAQMNPVKATSYKKKYVKLKYTKQNGVSGYQIYYSKNNGKFKFLATIKKTKSYYIFKKVQPGITYSYKVRAFKKVNGKRVYGEFSLLELKDKSEVIKSTETYEEKYKRAFAGDKAWYGDEARAKANMISITVACWDFKDSSHTEKITRNFTIRVNKYLAPTIKQIFKEIYEGKEKFPIHALGGYDWRGSSSTSEHCVGTALDINPYENPQYRNGKKTGAWGDYEPGKNPYSIPKDGELARIMNKYGFTQGLWHEENLQSVDYMHFSYFGG